MSESVAATKRYFTGKPCKNGHVAERFISNGGCVVCSRERLNTYSEVNADRLREKRKIAWANNREALSEKAKARREADPERIRSYSRKWRAKNVERERIRSSEYAKANVDSIRVYSKTRYNSDIERNRAAGRSSYWKNPEHNRAMGRAYRAERRDKMRSLWKVWAAENKDRLRFIRSQRRASELRATPSWADLNAIAAVYRESCSLERHDGIKRHVDHTVPLQGRSVCGLHVAYNLQVLPALENVSKGNRWDGDIRVNVESQYLEFLLNISKESE